MKLNIPNGPLVKVNHPVLNPTVPTSLPKPKLILEKKKKSS